MEILSEKTINDILPNFLFEGSFVGSESNTIGRINDTFILDFRKKKYVLQRVNDHVFVKPEEIMGNIEKVTSFLADKIKKRGGDSLRETLTIIKTKDGKAFYKNPEGFWRAYLFIDKTKTYNDATPKLFHEAAEAFSRFQGDLSDFPAEELHETIKGFHDTKARYSQFLKAIRKDPSNRGEAAMEEIVFLREHKNLAYELSDQVRKKSIPLRVTHNDTKLNNVLFDEKSGKAVCIIDLDTVMPGLSMSDFGDAIRFGANTASEEETDLSKVALNMELFRAYAKGYFKGSAGNLSEDEIALLPLGTETITYELALRFVTDFLEGDHYFKVTRENENIDRAKVQITLLKDMLSKHEQMESIIIKSANSK
jgi:thiamine kinase-like enzyme